MELFFRVAVAAIYFCQMAALIYSYRKTNDRNILHDPGREATWFFLARVFWVYVIIGAISLYVLFPHTLHWGSLALPPVLRLGGIAIGIASDALIAWILLSLGKNISATLKTRDTSSLVTTGPYRYVRHPLYSAGIPLFFSLALIASNWFLGLLGIGFQLFIMWARTPVEDNMLLERFGEEYRQYMQQVGAHFPRMAIFKSR